MKLMDWIYLVGSGRGGFEISNPYDCNVYLLDAGEVCMMVDAGAGIEPGLIIDTIEKEGFDPLNVKYIFLTHLHADHAGGAYALRAETGGQVAVHFNGARILEKGDEFEIDLIPARKYHFYPNDYRFKKCRCDIRLRHGSKFHIGKLTVEVMLLPGHSRFDTYFLVTNDATNQVVLFTGDGFFAGGRISMLATKDFDLQGLRTAIFRLKNKRFDCLLPGHNQPVLQNAQVHLQMAADAFTMLKVPPSIV
jgi:glyoxylase-like metal-dependent hydrolase (beta-lactamase superfamily II)